jgi:GH24 family phage-related lysozyme (muramidase)
MDISKFSDQLIVNEGLKLKMYHDTLNVPTIGVGFNLNRYDAQNKIEALGLNFEEIKNGQKQLTKIQAKQLLEKDIQGALKDAKDIFRNFDELSEQRQFVILDMTFNLGKTRLSTFKKLIGAIEQENFQKASEEMQNSNWAKQVGNRATRNIEAMRLNIFPSEVILDNKKNKKLLDRFSHFMRSLFS